MAQGQDNVKVFYAKGVHVTISFNSNELNIALKVLKALAKVFRAQFLLDVVSDLERDLAPKLPYTPYFHICEACKMEIDVRKDSYLHQNDRYTHYTCPVLKDIKERSK